MSATKDLTGQKFGKLTVIVRAPNIAGKTREYGAWECICECGNTKIVATHNLKRGSVKSCGCLVSQFGVSYKPGDKINRLTTISYKNGKWLCLCECGNLTEVPTGSLTMGNAKSCGCLKSEASAINATKLIEGRRKNEPRVASARRVWQGYCQRDEECVDFDIFYLLSQQNCVYCGIEPSTRYNYFSTPSSNSSQKAKDEGLFIYNGIDRVDNSKHHTADNIVPCCPICNRAKSDRHVNIFLQWVHELKMNSFQPIVIPCATLPINGSLATSIKCVFYNHKNDTDMTVQEYYAISQMDCFYCGAAPDNVFNRAKTDKKASEKAKQGGTYIYNGIDRVDRSLPHNKNNVVPCCYYCNHTKSGLTLQDFYDWILRIQSFRRAKNIIITT